MDFRGKQISFLILVHFVINLLQKQKSRISEENKRGKDALFGEILSSFQKEQKILSKSSGQRGFSGFTVLPGCDG